MALGKRLINTGAADAACTTDSTDPFGDGYGVALYSLDYDASTAPDGTDYSGTPTDVEFGVGGKINYGARFNGSSSSIETGISSLTNNFTISMWLNLESFISSKNAWIFSNWDSTSQDMYLAVHPNGQLELGIDGRTGTNIFGSSGTFTLNTWHHFLLTMNNGTYDLYFNGTQLDSSGTTTNTTFNSGSNFKIGNSPLTSGGYSAWNGSIDQVRIFNRALDETTNGEISALYAEQACVYDCTTDTVNYPPLTTPVAYYKLDNSSEDYSTGGNDGSDTNIEYRFGRYGQAAVFNGIESSSRSKITTSGLTTYNNFSISFWLNPDDVNNTRLIMGTSEGFLTQTGFGVFFGLTGNGNLTWRVSNGTSAVDIEKSSISTGNWHHIVITQNTSNNEKKLYVNGNLETTSTSTINATGQGYSLIIGGYNTYTNTPYDGDIDQVRIYSTALTDGQVTKLYEEKQCYITKDAADPFGDSNSVALYEMENNVNDTSGNNNNGTTSNVTFTSTDPIRGTYEATFNGSTDDISLPQFMGQNNYTFSAWFKIDALNDFQAIFSLNAIGSYKKAIFLHSGGTNNIRIFSQSANYYSSNNIYNTNQWYHIVFTKSSTNGIVVYLDANEIINEPTATANDPLSSEGYDYIGAYRTGGIEALHFDGSIDQVRIFDRALDGTEAYQLYAEGARGTGL